ncbi:exodeoxyribonuclease V subunit gamma [Gordonia sinesedis]
MFHLHRAERTDILADALADVLVEPLADPMRTEIVAVPARGVERWLGQRLATRLGRSPSGPDAMVADGIAANIDFSSPASLTDAVIAAAELAIDGSSGGIAVGDGDRWQAGALVWSVLAELDDSIDDPDLAVLARHVGAADTTRAGTAGTVRTDTDTELRLGRRFATARHIADLFDRYGRQRPDMIAGWARGDDSDGAGGRVPDDMAWQPRIWRAVRERIGRPHPAELLGDIGDRLRADPDVVDLPERLSVFGTTRITESFRQIMAALAVHRDIHLFVPHPSPVLWAAAADALAAAPAGDARRSDRVVPAIEHPLLASLSRDVQELQARIMPIVDVDTYHPPTRPPDGASTAADATPTAALRALQDGLRRDRLERGVSVAPGAAATADTSVEVHACHGPDRQVEVLRDRLLHLFDADPTLQPRDVLIMCPDVETFAPLVRGAFGQPGLGHPAFDLRVRLADRGQRHVNPVLDVLATVVELAAGRVTAGDVVDLLSRGPVARRFAITDDDLDMVREWLAHSNIRWGIDDTQRRRFGLGGFPQGTLTSGLDRIALGAVAEERDGLWLGTALPLDGVESTEIDLVGRFAEFADRLGTTVTALDTVAPASQWKQALIGAVDALTASGPGEEWQRAQAIRLLVDAFDTGADRDAHGSDRLLRLADVRDLVAGMIAGRPTRSNFRTGELTVCTMVPMRSVPHRVVVLLGVDAEQFPRAQRVDGDDILGRVPLIGERNPRDEDRQLFLDAVCAAQENLLVFYSGADPVTGSRIPPAVVVSELVDAVAAITNAPDTAGIVRHHTLHGFDARNFEPGAMQGVTGPFSYDTGLLDGARALRTEPAAPTPIADIAVAGVDTDDIALDDLVAFWTNPIEGFVRQRLGARMPADDRPHADELEVALAALDAWAVGDRMLRRMLDGDDPAACQAAELRRGTLPPFQFGRRQLQEISDVVARLYDAAASARGGAGATTRDVLVELPDGRRVYGSVPDVFDTTVVSATYSRLRAKQRLAAWIRLLALAAAPHENDRPPVSASLVVGRGPGVRAARSLLVPPPEPRAALDSLVRLRDRGLQSPLPVPLEPGAEYGSAIARTGRPDTALAAARRSFDNTFGASADPYLRLVYGIGADTGASVHLDDLLAVPVPADGRAGGVELPAPPGAPLFAGLAEWLWVPLLDHETPS